MDFPRPWAGAFFYIGFPRREAAGKLFFVGGEKSFRAPY
jgi:hypothetical protein